MAEDPAGAPLSRRVPGAARRASGQPAKPVLSDAVLNRMQAAVHAERAQAEPPRQDDPNTEPLPRVTATGSPGKRGAKHSPSPSGLPPDPVVLPGRAAEPERIPEPVGAAEAPPAESSLRVAKALRVVDPVPSSRVEPQPPVAAAPEPPVAAAPEPPVSAGQPAAAAWANTPELPVRAEPLAVGAWATPAEPSAPPPPRAAEPPAPRAAEPPPPTTPTIPGAPDPGPTPGSVGWLWPDQTATPGGGGPRWRPPSRRRYRTVTLITLAAGVLVGAGLFAGIALHSTPVAAGGAHGTSSPTPSAPATPSPSPTAPGVSPAELAQAVTWISGDVAAGTVVACDAQTCAALTAAGLPVSQQVQVGLNSQSLLSASIVVVTPELRGLFETTPSLGDYVAPAVLASFGSVSIQPIDSAGAGAYQAALNQDVQARIAMGEQLINSGYISASATAMSELEAGDVDSRVLLVLQALSTQEPIDILAFGDAGPGASQGIPFRGVQLAEFDANALVPRQQYLQVFQQVLAAQATFPPPQHAGPVPGADGQTVIQIEYAAPSPFGVLGSG
jgi:hypothetical protein